MSTIKLAVGLLAAGLFAGCATNGPGGTGGGDDDGDVVFTNGVSTLAGSAQAGFVDGSRKDARFSNPVNVAYRDGQLYVADFDNGKLRVIDTSTHNTRTVIAQAGFARPFGLAFAGDGTLYVSTDNDPMGGHNLMSGTIWKVNVDAKTATVLASSLGRPRGMAVLPDGRIAVADYQHHVIELVDNHTGKVTTIAGAWDTAGMVDGPGVTARFSAPYNIVVRSDGKLAVTDFDNNRIRLVGLDGATATMTGTTAPGVTDGAMTTAQFNHPQGMVAASNGDLYITDFGNFRVRRIVGSNVETLAGDGKAGHLDSDNLLASEIYGLEGLSVVPDGSMLYVADGNRGDGGPYNFVRQVEL